MSGSLLDLFDDRNLQPKGESASGRPAASTTGLDTPAPRRVLSVGELTVLIRNQLEGQFSEVLVEGELSNCRLWNTGHMYFTLKDADSQLRGIMFKSSVRSLRFEPKDGLRVVARGRIGVYERKGEYQIVCEKLEPEGLGALQLAFDQLKERLTAEGLFDPSRRRTLPVLPRKIGVVTSIGGAAIRDIIHVLRRRYPNSHVVIRPTRVQGDSAAEEVASALSAIARVNGVDVIIVGRGGGSIEDLWTFNEETVARAIAACPVPIISAVGHETDVTIADFVADVRAPTPSAAAELVVGRKEEFTGRIDRLARRVKAGTRTALHRKESLLRVLNARPGYAGFHARATLVARRVTDLTHELRYAIDASLTRRHKVHDGILVTLEVFDLRRRLGALRTRLVQTDGELQNVMTNCRHGANRRLQDAAARLDSLSPLAVLGRGYSVCWNADRTAVIRRANDVQTGHLVRVTLAEGELACKVTMVEMEDTGRK